MCSRCHETRCLRCHEIVCPRCVETGQWTEPVAGVRESGSGVTSRVPAPLLVGHEGSVTVVRWISLRIFGPSSWTISLTDTSRLRMDSAMTASWSDLYQSSGSNWDVTTVAPWPSLLARLLRILLAVAIVIGVVRK